MEMAISGKLTIYNLIADLCGYITRKDSRIFLVRYSCISDTEKERIMQKIRRETEIRMNEEEKALPIIEDELTQKYLLRLLHLAQHMKQTGDKNGIMRLLQLLDQALANILEDEVREYEASDMTYYLNTNQEQTGIGILPKTSCVWARKSRQSFSYRRVDNHLHHMLVVERDMMDEIDDHVFLPKGFFRNFDETGMLKVAATPLANKPDFYNVFHEKESVNVFSLHYLEDKEQEWCDLVWDKIVEAGANEAELAVFPEMLGTEHMEEDISRRLKALSPEEQERIPSMIILPSYFAECQNYCSVLDRHGNLIKRQYKQNPYIMDHEGQQYIEDINGNGEVVIFHYEGIGRFAILICKDFLATRYMEHLMRGLRLTMIIVPSYSTGMYDFQTSIDLCYHDYCNVVWINSCAAMIPGKEQNFEYIGFVRKRVGRQKSEDFSYCRMSPCAGLMNGTCNKDCLYYDTFGKYVQLDEPNYGQQ